MQSTRTSFSVRAFWKMTFLLLLSCSNETTLQFGKTITPRSLVKWLLMASETSLSSRGKMRLAVSMSNTLIPRLAKYSVISHPVEPPPTTRATLGERRILMAVSGVRKLTVSVPLISDVLSVEPVARIKFSAVNLWLFRAIVWLSIKWAKPFRWTILDDSKVVLYDSLAFRTDRN